MTDKTICAATGQPCSGCEPGRCEHKEAGMTRLTERITRNGRDYNRIKGCATLYAAQERKGAHQHNAIVRLAWHEDRAEDNNGTREAFVRALDEFKQHAKELENEDQGQRKSD